MSSLCRNEWTELSNDLNSNTVKVVCVVWCFSVGCYGENPLDTGKANIASGVKLRAATQDTDETRTQLNSELLWLHRQSFPRTFHDIYSV